MVTAPLPVVFAVVVWEVSSAPVPVVPAPPPPPPPWSLALPPSPPAPPWPGLWLSPPGWGVTPALPPVPAFWPPYTAPPPPPPPPAARPRMVVPSRIALDPPPPPAWPVSVWGGVLLVGPGAPRPPVVYPQPPAVHCPALLTLVLALWPAP